jgi:hypothetical protein
MAYGFETRNGDVYTFGPGGETKRHSKSSRSVHAKPPQATDWSHCVFLAVHHAGKVKPLALTDIYEPSTQWAHLFYIDGNNLLEPMLHDMAGRPLPRPVEFAKARVKIDDAASGQTISCPEASAAPILGLAPLQIVYDRSNFGVPHLGPAITQLFLSVTELASALRGVGADIKTSLPPAYLEELKKAEGTPPANTNTLERDRGRERTHTRGDDHREERQREPERDSRNWWQKPPYTADHTIHTSQPAHHVHEHSEPVRRRETALEKLERKEAERRAALTPEQRELEDRRKRERQILERNRSRSRSFDRGR